MRVWVRGRFAFAAEALVLTIAVLGLGAAPAGAHRSHTARGGDEGGGSGRDHGEHASRNAVYTETNNPAMQFARHHGSRSCQASQRMGGVRPCPGGGRTAESL